MTLAAWPGTLPAAPLIDGMQETLPDTVLRTDMDQGPAKLRRRTTAGIRILTVSYLLTHTQSDALESFYLDTLAGGALSFAYPHPRSRETVTCRFRKTPALAALNGSFFRAVLELEVLP